MNPFDPYLLRNFLGIVNSGIVTPFYLKLGLDMLQRDTPLRLHTEESFRDLVNSR